MEQMAKSTANQQMHAPPENDDQQMEFMLNILVEQSEGQDKLFFEANGEFENEEFERSLMYYYTRDPEVQREMQSYMQKMQQMMPGGGMAGGMGGPRR